MLRLVMMIAALLLPGQLAYGQDIPVPPSKHQIMAAPEQLLRDQTLRQQRLHENLERIDDEIGSLRSTMIKVAREVKRREREMSDLEDKIDAAQTQRTALQRKLQKDHRDIANMASALLRLRAVPPEALLARPGAPLETAQAAMILQDVIAPLQQHAAALNTDLTALATLEADLTTRQAALKNASKRILADQTKLADLIRRRENAYSSLQNDIKIQDNDLKRLSQDAADFKDLVKRLEERNRDIAAANTSQNILPKDRANVSPARLPRSFGDIQMPISGIIRLGYGRQDAMGAASEGIKIEGRAGALVVAPIDGIIRYKGYFKNYGNMIIIEHAKNYHSLVAGLAKIDTVVGQSVAAGEPLGHLGTTRSARPSLYYELRQNGKPVNPAKIFADLG